MAYFPLFINLEGMTVLVIGGGAIAARRVNALLEFGCSIYVISPKICERMESLLQNDRVKWIPDVYRGEMVLRFTESKLAFVLAAAPKEINEQVVKACRAAQIPVNDASNKENCDFYFPGLIKDGDVVVGVTAGGSDHKLVAALSAKIREWMKSKSRCEPCAEQNRSRL